MKQRQLTQEELNNAPDWAVDVRYRNKSFVFTDGKYKVQFLDGGRCDSTKVKSWDLVHKIQPIPHRAFDISEYQFSDNDIHGAKVISEANEIEIELKLEVDFISLNKSELIAMTKALGVTAEDFKQGG